MTVDRSPARPEDARTSLFLLDLGLALGFLSGAALVGLFWWLG